MQRYSLTHLADATLLEHGLRSARTESASTATLLAHIAEIDHRRLYADEGYDSMSTFCIAEWGLCEYAAYRRIDAARAARQFPALFEAVADGRLSLTAVNLLAPALREANAAELIAAASRLTKRQVQDLLAERAAKAQATALKQVVASELSNGLLAPALVAPNGASDEGSREAQIVAPSPEAVPAPAGASASLRYPLHALLGKAEQEDLDYLRALLGHAVPSGEITQVLGRVFQAAIRELERAKFAVTSRTRKGARGESANPHHVPAPVRRAVLVRDGGCCTFVSVKGHRCASRNRLEFDHIQPVAKGGKSTVANVQLRCHTQNQHAAERAFGVGFMERKRKEARHSKQRKRRAEKANAAERERREAYARELAANEAARSHALADMPWLGRHQVPAGERCGGQPGTGPPD